MFSRERLRLRRVRSSTACWPEQLKTGWMRADLAGDKGPWRQQSVLAYREEAAGYRPLPVPAGGKYSGGTPEPVVPGGCRLVEEQP